jgi:large subunit ribosomal protein L6
MSRIGNKPVPVPKGVEVQVSGGELRVKGPKGQLTQDIVDGISFDVQDGRVVVSRGSDVKQIRANHGLMRALLNNMVVGVSRGFTRNLEIIGVGYKAQITGNKAVFNLGYSHPINFPFPDGIKISVDKNTKISVTGISKEAVGQAASEIRGFRPPDPYKGKGVRYEGEYVRLKAGKTAQ